MVIYYQYIQWDACVLDYIRQRFLAFGGSMGVSLEPVWIGTI